MQTALGFTILAIALLIWRSKRSEYPAVAAPDRLATALRLNGVYHDPVDSPEVRWQTHRTPAGLVLFAGIGMLAIAGARSLLKGTGLWI